MRLIDADALKDRLKEYCIDGDTNAGYWYSIMGIDDCIDNAPTIDAEPVVHCRDCKYWQDNNGGYPHEECRWGKEETPDGDDFCSYGERGEP